MASSAQRRSHLHYHRLLFSWFIFCRIDNAFVLYRLLFSRFALYLVACYLLLLAVLLLAVFVSSLCYRCFGILHLEGFCQKEE